MKSTHSYTGDAHTDSVASWTPSSDVRKSWVTFGTFSQLCFNTKYGTRQLRADREPSWPHWPIFSQAISARLTENSINPSRQVPIINMGNLEASFQSLKFLLLENTSVLIFPCSQPVKMLHIFSAPIQRNLSFAPYLMPYVGSWKNEGFSCQSLKAVQALFQLHTASDLQVWHFTLASVSTICSVSLVHCWKYSW